MIFTSTGQTLAQGESARGFWRAQAAGWIVLAIIGFCIRLAVFGNATAAFWLTLGLEPLAFALTSAAAVLHGRRRPRPGSQVPVIACAVLSCLAASALLASIGYAIHQLLVPGVLEAVPHNQFRLGFIYYMGILSIWTLIYFGVSAELAARAERFSKMQAESRALRLELERLQQQIEPHFLFNSLSTIVAEIAGRPAIAEEMTRRLAGYLRYSLDRRGRGLCRLQEEIEAAQAYVRIMALRFDARLECRCRVDPAMLDVELPHMTLQGLVENAIKHGIRSEHESFVIDINARRDADELVIEVANPGRLQASFDLAQGSGGLGNLCRRLALRYADRCRFSLDERAGRIVAEIRVWGVPDPL